MNPRHFYAQSHVLIVTIPFIITIPGRLQVANQIIMNLKMDIFHLHASFTMFYIFDLGTLLPCMQPTVEKKLSKHVVN